MSHPEIIVIMMSVVVAVVINNCSLVTTASDTVAHIIGGEFECFLFMYKNAVSI